MIFLHNRAERAEVDRCTVAWRWPLPPSRGTVAGWPRERDCVEL